ncbi:flavodoxin-dependent (E)-4-hydroxy-3-methylbut-2-enyl-diphosphate synthase [bacterium]|nr:flavodoxin-dependent (E)-4-hydroxy-3-methylbut-2-enyl-diphosphate synthase [bacterium]
MLDNPVFTQKRRITREVFAGKVAIGGQSPVTVQSMTNTKTDDVESTVEQIRVLSAAGCDIIRVAVPDKKAGYAIPAIKEQINIPLVADIHFDYRLALLAIEMGADKIRINPGNIGSEERVAKILEAASLKSISIRIGVNSGSLEKDILSKYGHPGAQALAESALRHIKFCEKHGFYDIVVSVKASDVGVMIEANRIVSKETDYPVHLGVTESGSVKSGVIRSAVGIGTLLAEGIGDTIRVSLTGDNAEEIRAGFTILNSLHLRKKGVTIISCPTCGRTETDVTSIVEELEEALKDIDKPVVVAVMGCAVNGPGEAREADIGVACGKNEGLLFKKGEVIKKIPEKDIVSVLKKEVDEWKENSEK